MSDAPTTLSTPQVEEIEQIQAEAKQTFSLTKRLLGGKRRTKVIPVFLDEEALDEMADLKRQITATEARLSEADKPSDATTQTLADLQAQLALVRPRALASALKVELSSLPDPAVKIARRDARTGATNQEGVIVEDDFNAYFTKNLVVAAITKVTDPSGAEANLDHDEVAAFYDGLSSIQKQSLDTAVSSIQFQSNVAIATTDEPGF